jgi:hypothetical protein
MSVNDRLISVIRECCSPVHTFVSSPAQVESMQPCCAGLSFHSHTSAVWLSKPIADWCIFTTFDYARIRPRFDLKYSPSPHRVALCASLGLQTAQRPPMGLDLLECDDRLGNGWLHAYHPVRANAPQSCCFVVDDNANQLFSRFL